MATKPQRAQAVLDALIDGAMQPAAVSRVLDAYAYFAGEEPANLTQAQKATVFLRCTRDYVRSTVHAVETAQAEKAARQNINPPDLGTD